MICLCYEASMGHIGWLLVFSVFVLQDGVLVHDVGTYTCVGADAGRFKQLLSVARRARLPSSCCFYLVFLN